MRSDAVGEKVTWFAASVTIGNQIPIALDIVEMVWINDTRVRLTATR